MSAVPDVRRLAIRAPNWLGDAVVALPAMAAVRAALPDAVVAVAAIPAVAPLFHERTALRADEVIAVADKRSERQRLHDGRFEAILLLPNSFGSAWVARRASIPERWGYGTRLRSLLLTRAVVPPMKHVHQATYYLELVRGLGISADEQLPRVTVTPKTASRAMEMLEDAGVRPEARLVGFAPGAAYGHAKRWPPRRVAEVIARLARERGAVSVLVGAVADRDAGREIESSLPPDVHAINLIGRTSLRELAGVLARCAAFVSNDSGAMHLAAALGVPVVAIFGPTDERVTAPLGDHEVLLRDVFCRPCMLRDCPIDHRCMKRIAPADVFAAVTRRLDARA